MPKKRQGKSSVRRRVRARIAQWSGGVKEVFAASVACNQKWSAAPRRSKALLAIAERLSAQRDEVLNTAAAETALTRAELEPEFDRMTGTLRLFAGVVREGSWVRAAIDRHQTGSVKTIGPNHDVRSMLRPLGVVAVFGASNFPLAYGVCGGDTASALAAGCAVVVKEHPAHPQTGRLLHGIAQSALYDAGFHPGVLEYVENTDPSDFGVARRLLAASMVRAVGFTGSFKAGRAIDDLARARGWAHPIPVFAEMGSINPVRISEGAMAARPAEIANQLADSILLRHGQQCTKPGVIFVHPPKRGMRTFIETLTARFKAAPSRDMLAPWIRDAYRARLRQISRAKGVRVLARGAAGVGPRAAQATLFYLKRTGPEPSTILEEVFGPATVIIELPDWSDINMARPSALTWTIYCEPKERASFGPEFEAGVLEHFCGRLVFNGPPTGVRVAHGMVHGGPWPATNRPDTTAVGPRAIERWCRPVCWQNCPQKLLPPELQDHNPRGIWRMVDGEWSRK